MEQGETQAKKSKTCEGATKDKKAIAIYSAWTKQ